MSAERGQAIFKAVAAMAPSVKDALHDIGMTMKQKGVQGAAELSGALFSQSNAFTPYGPGQNAPKDHDHSRGMSR